MLMTLILAAAIGQSPEWHNSANHSGWQAFGVPINGWLDPQRWRQTANPSIEWIADGDPVPDGYRKVHGQSGATSDQWGFTAWLNSTRAAYGLPGVAWDEGMAQAAAVNNQWQVSYGIGHFAMAVARVPNAAMMSYPALLNAWMNSADHRAALLDPNLVHVGIAFAGAYVTFAGR